VHHVHAALQTAVYEKYSCIIT